MSGALKRARAFKKPSYTKYPDIDLISKWKIVRGDTVQVMTGKEKTKTGKVLEVFRDTNRLLVQGVNLIKRSYRTMGDKKGGVVTKEASIHYSNVALLDPVSGKPTRISMKFLENGEKVRISKQSGSVIPKPLEAIGKRRIRAGTLCVAAIGWEWSFI
eukprot:TRINITY_DN2127_c0_g1_i1.p1 TRINITY_DN2127_c0_g1~~TRINITY_DN2127_c0_g1_i1.p1  ORF type:complete len:158 (+),score=18.35 TRINITY_DN2127_c0_g1_i1:130-603(+)